MRELPSTIGVGYGDFDRVYSILLEVVEATVGITKGLYEEDGFGLIIEDGVDLGVGEG